MRKYLGAVILAVFALFVNKAATQEIPASYILKQASGTVYVQYARYSDKDRTNPVEKKWVYSGSSWAYRSYGQKSIWITNAHVVQNNPNRSDNNGRWWFPTGVYGIRMQGKLVIPATRVLKVDESLDLAALEVPVPVPAISCIEEGEILEEERVVNVSSPLGIRYVVVYGTVIRRNVDDYDVDEIAGSGVLEGKYSGGHLWLDIRVTHGSSGSAVVLVRNGCLAGVIRGYWVAGLFAQMGEPFIYAIPNTSVLKFVKGLDATDNS